MKRTLLMGSLLLAAVSCFSQSDYFQSHKEIEYHFGMIDDADIPLISETEKIKYEFKQIERSVKKTIDRSFRTKLEVLVDYNDYEQGWMKLAKRFTYDANGITLYNKGNEVMERLEYTSDVQESNLAIVTHIREHGYHPGLIVFPVYSNQLADVMGAQGISIKGLDNGTVMEVSHPNGSKEVYNAEKLTIVKDWVDEEGVRIVETSGYVPYLPQKGYLLKLRKTERFIRSVNGPCITEVKFLHYKDYVINDPDKLIDKATHTLQAIFLSPNPNTGVFTVTVQLSPDDVISNTIITNLLTGESFAVNAANSKVFNVDMAQLETGHYVVQVFSSQTTLRSNFLKQ